VNGVGGALAHGVRVNQRNVIFAVVTAVGIALDQATKIWVVQNIQEGLEEIPVIPGWFSLVHRQNPGAAFGIFQNFEYRHWLFLVFTLVAAGVILDLFRRLPTTDKFMSATLGLILSGAVGNAIDRVHKQTVTDFLKVYTEWPPLESWLRSSFGTNEWPSFNIADSALVVGVIFYIFHQMFLEERQTTPAPAKDAA
jgi:signal peptidase II